MRKEVVVTINAEFMKDRDAWEQDAKRLGISFFRVMYVSYKKYLQKNHLEHSDANLIAYKQMCENGELRK